MHGTTGISIFIKIVKLNGKEETAHKLQARDFLFLLLNCKFFAENN